MIFTERTITVVNDSATINKPLILYRGDKNIELKITIAESQFKFRNTDASNVIETTDASYAQLVINTPYGLPIFSDVAATKNGAVIFVITEAMIDEIREVGAYEIQIRLLDDNKQSRASIPPVSNAIEIREPIAIEDGSVVDSNAVNVAKVNRALTTTSAPLEVFDSQGNYIKKTWGDGDPITDAALNKMEAGIDGVNKKVANNSSQIKEKANFDYVNNKVFTMANMGQDIKEAMTGGSVAVVGIDSILTENIVDKQVVPSKTNFFNIGTNLANPSDFVIGRLQDDGNIDVSASSYTTTGWINIKSNQIGMYIVGQIANGKIIYNSLKFYDSNKNSILPADGGGQMGTGTTAFVIPSNASYVRLSFAGLSETQFYYVEINDTGLASNNITKYSCKIKKDFIDISSLDNDFNIVTPEKTSFFDIGDNLADYNSLSVGRLQNDGTLSSDASYFTTDFISIDNSQIGMYVVGQLTNNTILYHSVRFYKKDKTMIASADGGGQMGTSTNAIKIPSEARYVRLSFCLKEGQYPFVGINETGTAFTSITKYVYRLNPSFCDRYYWYKNKKITFYGDSITAKGNWQNYINEYFELKEWVNCGVGGSTVANVDANLDYDSNPNKPMCTDERIATIPLDSDVIIFFGGANDWGAKVPIGTIKDGETTFKGAYMITLKKLQERCPNAIIMAMTPINGRLNNAGVAQDYPMELSNGKTVRDYSQAIIDVCNLYAIPCIDLNADCRINTLNAPNYLEDTIHQNSKGAKLIANSCINGMKRFEPINLY